MNVKMKRWILKTRPLCGMGIQHSNGMPAFWEAWASIPDTIHAKVVKVALSPPLSWWEASAQKAGQKLSLNFFILSEMVKKQQLGLGLQSHRSEDKLLPIPGCYVLYLVFLTQIQYFINWKLCSLACHVQSRNCPLRGYNSPSHFTDVEMEAQKDAPMHLSCNKTIHPLKRCNVLWTCLFVFLAFVLTLFFHCLLST